MSASSVIVAAGPTRILVIGVISGEFIVTELPRFVSNAILRYRDFYGVMYQLGFLYYHPEHKEV